MVWHRKKTDVENYLPFPLLNDLNSLTNSNYLAWLGTEWSLYILFALICKCLSQRFNFP